MTREEKIKVLQAIQEGKLLPEDIEPVQVFVFSEIIGSDPIMYKSDFGNVDAEQKESIIQDIELKNKRRTNCGLPTDTVIELNYTRCAGKGDLTFDIE